MERYSVFCLDRGQYTQMSEGSIAGDYNYEFEMTDKVPDPDRGLYLANCMEHARDWLYSDGGRYQIYNLDREVYLPNDPSVLASVLYRYNLTHNASGYLALYHLGEISVEERLARMGWYVDHRSSFYVYDGPGFQLHLFYTAKDHQCYMQVARAGKRLLTIPEFSADLLHEIWLQKVLNALKSLVENFPT